MTSKLSLVLLAAAVVACTGESDGQSGGTGGGKGGDGGSGGGGMAGVGGGNPSDCVDIVVDGLRGISDVDPWVYDVPRFPAWPDVNGLHVAWLGRPVGDPGGEQRPLVLSSFDARTGDPKGDAVFLDRPRLDAVAGNPDGDFVVAWGYLTAKDTTFQELLLGNTSDPAAARAWSPPWSTEDAYVFHIAWDGETFGLNALKLSEPGIWVARLLPDGTLVQDLTRVAALGPIGYDLWDSQTDPETGETYFVFEGDDVGLSGHLRGEPLPAMDGADYLSITPPGMSTMNGAFPGVGYSPESLLISWSTDPLFQGELALLLSRESLEPQSDAIGIPPGSQTNAPPRRGNRTVALHEDRFWLFASDPYRIDRLLVDGANVPEPDALVTATSGVGALAMMSFTWEGELWLGYWDNSESQPNVTSRTYPYRLLRVAEGCSYESTYDLRHGL